MNINIVDAIIILIILLGGIVGFKELHTAAQLKGA